jgi:hypothetical protein
MYPKTSSRIGFTINIEAGERTPRSVANWLLSLLHISPENVRCVMGYIINLTVILDEILRTTGGKVTENGTLRVMGTHVRSGRRDSIHEDIRGFVTETFSMRSIIPEKDLVLERIVSLIKKNCAPPNS